MPGDASSNSQTQTQQQTITISLESAGDPELEGRIFSQVHSVGRQLGYVSAVLEVLIAAHGSDPTFGQAPDARRALDDFSKAQIDILREKSLRDPERVIRQLEALRRVDPAAFAATRERLSSWLQNS
ncbi:MAG: hypothetical protein ABW061_04555 [Polyangiaceae bacterium]